MKDKVVELVQLKIRGAYGRELLYPANKTAELFCKLAKSKTMTLDAIALIVELGYTVQYDRVDFASSTLES